jgi:hypothetical protein
LNTTAKKIGKEGTRNAGHEVPALKTEVDLILSSRIGDTHGGEDLSKVVGDKAVARPLREETNTGGDEETVKVSTGFEEFDPGEVGGFLLEVDSLTDLLELGENEGVIAVPLSMVLGKDFEGLLAAVLRDEPAGRLGDKPNEDDLQHRRDDLKQ